MFLVALPSLAADEKKASAGHGYGYSSLGCVTEDGCRLYGFGAGGEGYLWKGLAAGVDAGYQFFDSHWSEGFGLVSVNGSYHFTNSARRFRVAPFVTGGYGLGFREGTANFVNAGGGLTWWFRDRLGFRPEVRVYYSNEMGAVVTMVRFSLAFR
jgi:hypothetical protein